MIKVEVVRSVMRDTTADLFADARNRLTAIVAGDPAAEKNWLPSLTKAKDELKKSLPRCCL